MRKKTLLKLLQEAQELNIPDRDCRKTKQKLEKTITQTKHKNKDIIFENDTLICKECLNELKRQQIIDERVHYQKSWRMQ